jgi:outer membrane protein
MTRLPFLLAAAAAAFATAAPAQETTVTIGAGAQVYPQYPGADDYGIYPLLTGGLRRAGEPMEFGAPDDGFGIGLLGSHSRVDFGPVVRFQNKRRQRDVGADVGNVPFTVEGGGFVEAWLGDNFRLRADARRGLGGHDGWIGDVGADFVLRDDDSYIFSIGPRLRWSDDRYQDTYFGVTPAVATATGLPAYNPGGGIHAVGAEAGLTYRLGRRWGLFGYAGYDRLVGDAADSPIVRAFGSRDQFSGGLGLFYEFDVNLGL